MSEELKEISNAELSQILKACPMGLALSDKKQTITWVNETFENYLGIKADEINGHNISELPEVLQPLFTSTTAVHIPANSIRDDQWYMCSHQPINGNTAHYISDVGPIHLLMKEREYLQNELREALAIDEVTGLPNKIALFQSLEPQISRSRRYNNLLSIVIMRVNDLDQLDQTQQASLLVAISQLLKDQVRWADIVGKLNETDFLLVLPETAAEACNKLTANLTEHLEEMEKPKGITDNFKIATSFGHAQWEKGDDLTLLMQKARNTIK